MDPIVVSSLRKSYGAVKAVQGVNFNVETGRIFGLIGPDGGGKTTILRSVVSLLSIDSGEVFFMGRPVDGDPSYVRSHIGCLSVSVFTRTSLSGRTSDFSATFSQYRGGSSADGSNDCTSSRVSLRSVLDERLRSQAV